MVWVGGFVFKIIRVYRSWWSQVRLTTMPLESFAIDLELVILRQAYLALMIVCRDSTNSVFISDAGVSP